MTRPCILAIGLAPRCVDLSAFPGLTPELVRHHIDAQIEGLRGAGYDAESCLIDVGETAGEAAAAALARRRWDCVVIGAGLRAPPERLLLFEQVINLVHALAPQARIAFNTRPGDTAEAAGRWLRP